MRRASRPLPPPGGSTVDVRVGELACVPKGPKAEGARPLIRDKFAHTLITQKPFGAVRSVRFVRVHVKALK